MLKLVIKIQEKEDNNMNVGLKKISKKEFELSTQLEKVIATRLKAAIEDTLYSIMKENEKEGN